MMEGPCPITLATMRQTCTQQVHDDDAKEGTG